MANFTCQICMSLVSEEERFRSQKSCCSHSLCVDCMSYYIKVMVESNKMAQIRCPDLYCDNLLDPISCSPIIPANVFEKWCDLLCESEVFRWRSTSWAYCPSRDCSELILNECGGGGGSVRESSCPKCNTLFCFQCGNAWHRGYQCNESRRIRDNDDEFLLVQLAETNKWTKCPGCKCFVERIDGCSIIRCRCGTCFCHDCGEQCLWHWNGCKKDDQDIGRCERILMYFFTLLLMVFCYFIILWAKRYEASKNTLS